MSWVGGWFGYGQEGTWYEAYSVLDTGAAIWKRPTSATVQISNSISGAVVMGTSIQVYTGNDWPLQFNLKHMLTPNTPPTPADVSGASRIAYALIQEQSKVVIIPTQLSQSDDVGANWATGVIMCPFDHTLTNITPGAYAVEILVEINGEQTTWTRVPLIVKQALVTLP